MVPSGRASRKTLHQTDSFLGTTHCLANDPRPSTGDGILPRAGGSRQEAPAQPLLYDTYLWPFRVGESPTQRTITPSKGGASASPHTPSPPSSPPLSLRV